MLFIRVLKLSIYFTAKVMPYGTPSTSFFCKVKEKTTHLTFTFCFNMLFYIKTRFFAMSACHFTENFKKKLRNFVTVSKHD